MSQQGPNLFCIRTAGSLAGEGRQFWQRFWGGDMGKIFLWEMWELSAPKPWCKAGSGGLSSILPHVCNGSFAHATPHPSLVGEKEQRVGWYLQQLLVLGWKHCQRLQEALSSPCLGLYGRYNLNQCVLGKEMLAQGSVNSGSTRREFSTKSQWYVCYFTALPMYPIGFRIKKLIYISLWSNEWNEVIPDFLNASFEGLCPLSALGIF